MFWHSFLYLLEPPVKTVLYRLSNVMITNNFFGAKRYDLKNIFLLRTFINYVYTILRFFDHLLTFKYTFRTLKVDKIMIFWTSYPPLLDRAVIERPSFTKKLSVSISFDLIIRDHKKEQISKNKIKYSKYIGMFH